MLDYKTIISRAREKQDSENYESLVDILARDYAALHAQFMESEKMVDGQAKIIKTQKLAILAHKDALWPDGAPVAFKEDAKLYAVVTGQTVAT